jgi:hypothetical protein
MPCTPAKARHLFKSGKARPKRNKLGLFYVQLCYEQQPDHQPLVVGVDPGSKFEGVSVVGIKDTVLNLMVEAPDHVKEAVETRGPCAGQGASASGAGPGALTIVSSGSTGSRHPRGADGKPKLADKSVTGTLWTQENAKQIQAVVLTQTTVPSPLLHPLLFPIYLEVQDKTIDLSTGGDGN